MFIYWLNNLNMGAGSSSAQLFEEALVAYLETMNLGIGGPFKTFVPQTWDYGTSGAALTYSVPTKPYGHVLTGSDGTANARVQLDVYGYSESAIDTAIETIRLNLDGPPIAWGNGTCKVFAVIQQNTADLNEPPKAGTDQWLYRTMAEYLVRYRLTIPS